MSKPDARFRHGFAMHREGKLADAERAYESVLRSQPAHFDALHLMGVIALQTGRQERGVGLIGRALSVNGRSASAYGNRANGLAALGRLDEAIASYDRAIALDPAFAEAHSNRGVALAGLTRDEEAVASHDAAIALKPDYWEAHFRRGNALLGLERYEEAVASYDRAIALAPNHPDAHGNRGSALLKLGRLEDAVASYDHAIGLKPDYAEAHYNRGSALRDLGRSDQALASYDSAITFKPDLAQAHYDRGNALRDLCRHEDAIASYDTAISLKPDFAEAHWNQSLCRLALGDYDRGWTQYEWRWWAELAHARPDLPGLPWLGDVPLDGKTILVVAEQGFGDSLQFCRYIAMLAARARVVLEVPQPLQRLFEGLEGASQVITPGDPRPRFDCWTPMTSLPLAFGTTLETIPATVPYLQPDPDQSARWRERLAALPGRKVGLVWAGSAQLGDPRATTLDSRRSISLQQYAPLGVVPGLCLVSLQKGEAGAQAQTPPQGMVLHDWTDELDDFADTAALVAALDLVISIDTSVVHLAGALNTPIWVLNRYDQCWRWLRQRTDSPWYPSARLFQQQTPGDWLGVICEVADALAQS